LLVYLEISFRCIYLFLIETPHILWLVYLTIISMALRLRLSILTQVQNSNIWIFLNTSISAWNIKLSIYSFEPLTYKYVINIWTILLNIKSDLLYSYFFIHFSIKPDGFKNRLPPRKRPRSMWPSINQSHCLRFAYLPKLHRTQSSQTAKYRHRNAYTYENIAKYTYLYIILSIVDHSCYTRVTAGWLTYSNLWRMYNYMSSRKGLEFFLRAHSIHGYSFCWAVKFLMTWTFWPIIW